MRFSAPRVSKAVAAVALMAVGALIAVSLLADAGRASAWMEERGVSLREDNQSGTEGWDFHIDENNAANHLLGRVAIRQNNAVATTGYWIVTNPVENPTLYVLFKDADGDIVARDSDDVASTEIVSMGTTGAVAVDTFEITAEADSDVGVKAGELRVPIAGALDHEKKYIYTLTVLAGEFVANEDRPSATVTIIVNDVNEPPFFVRHDLDSMSDQQAINYCLRDDIAALRLTNPPIIRINENAAIGSAIADYDACDPEEDDVIFGIRDSSESVYFDIDRGTGQLSVDDALDYEVKSTYTIEVEVLDDEFVDRLTQRIHLNNINEPVTPTPTRTTAPTATPTRAPALAVTPTPTTTPGRVNQDVLHRVGALEQLLARLQTLIQSLQGVIAAQDSRIAAQDDTIAAQDGRIAALEAQMAAGALTPTPTPQPTATPSPTPTATATPEPTPASSACVQAMRPGSVSGSWSSACLTANPTHGNTYYARFYTFTLDEAADVTITLSSDKPPYLYLLASAGMSGDVLQQAGGDGQTSVAITDTLRAGSYTIEASTWRPKTLGDFTLTLTARE